MAQFTVVAEDGHVTFRSDSAKSVVRHIREDLHLDPMNIVLSDDPDIYAVIPDALGNHIYIM